MRLEILRSVMISGEPALAGSFVEVTPSDANLLVGSNKARLAPEPSPEPTPAAESPSETPKRSRKPTAPTTPEED